MEAYETVKGADGSPDPYMLRAKCQVWGRVAAKGAKRLLLVLM